MRKFIEDSGRQAVDLISDGLIYISRTGHPVDPSGIVLEEFGIIKVTSNPVNDEACEKNQTSCAKVRSCAFGA